MIDEDGQEFLVIFKMNNWIICEIDELQVRVSRQEPQITKSANLVSKTYVVIRQIHSNEVSELSKPSEPFNIVKVQAEVLDF